MEHLKSISDVDSPFALDTDARKEAAKVGAEMSRYFDHLRMNAEPDEIKLTVRGIDGASYVIDESAEVVSGAIAQLSVTLRGDSADVRLYADFGDRAQLSHHFRPETTEQSDLNYADVVAELATMLDTSDWPPVYLDNPQMGAKDFAFFVEDTLLPPSREFEKQVTYNAHEHGTGVSEEYRNMDVKLRHTQAGAVVDGEARPSVDYVAMLVEEPGTTGVQTHVVAKSAFTVSTAVYHGDPEHRELARIKQPEDYLQRVRFGFGVLAAQKDAETIFGNSLHSSND